MRIGLVCPYSFDVAGGVQFHVRDLAEHLRGSGHHVEVLAPADDDTPLPDFVTSSGRALPIRYNGSVARLTFGPKAGALVSRWLESGDFDVVHIHEPFVPSVSILALWAAKAPIVATFHSSLERSRAMRAASPMVRAGAERINGRIAVSQMARRTVITHVGGDAVVIPNGVVVEDFSSATPEPRWQGTAQRPTIAFLGRIDEPRKGLPVLLEALPQVLREMPGLRVLVAGFGDIDAARVDLRADLADAVEFLGPLSDEDKAALLASVDVYVAPHTGGESFGIVLVEAMSAGAPVLAADLTAFRQVLGGGTVGATFPVGDADALSTALIELLGDESRRRRLSESGQRYAHRFDWSIVASDVVAVYETVIAGTSQAPVARPWRPPWSPLLRPVRRIVGQRRTMRVNQWRPGR